MSADGVEVRSYEQLRRSPTASLYEGGDEIDVSVFITAYERGQGVGLHVHPYPETFVVEAGTAKFTVGEQQLIVEAGHVLTVPGETPHRFEGAGDDQLRVVSIHPSPSVLQTDLRQD